MTRKVAVLVGSLRAESYNRKVARAVMALASGRLHMEMVEIGGLPLYNQDQDNDPPQPWIDLRQQVKASDGLLFVTPEYNRSIPAPLKNAIDIGSRPYGSSVWAGKPGAVISVSPGAIGGFGANHHLRQTFVFLDIPCMQQPEAYLGGASDDWFDAQGNLTNERTRTFLHTFVEAYAGWVERHSAARA